jgi:AraC-like DNA-binding protein
MISYKKYEPASALKKHIDFYWILQTGSNYQPFKAPLYADACTDIFINAGENPGDFNGSSPLLPGCVYVGGTTTTSSFVRSLPDSIFIGIRFKPGGLTVFYDIPLYEIVDQIVEIQDNHLFSLIGLDESLTLRFDQCFIARQKESRSVTAITETVYYSKGRISVDSLARQCNVSNRTMERMFSRNVGVSPKEFINIVRFQHTLNLLHTAHSKGRLMQIASDMGYSDHAHLTREIKKYSGLKPSGIWPGPPAFP